MGDGASHPPSLEEAPRLFVQAVWCLESTAIHGDKLLAPRSRTRKSQTSLSTPLCILTTSTGCWVIPALPHVGGLGGACDVQGFGYRVFGSGLKLSPDSAVVKSLQDHDFRSFLPATALGSFGSGVPAKLLVVITLRFSLDLSHVWGLWASDSKPANTLNMRLDEEIRMLHTRTSRHPTTLRRSLDPRGSNSLCLGRRRFALGVCLPHSSEDSQR